VVTGWKCKWVPELIYICDLFCCITERKWSQAFLAFRHSRLARIWFSMLTSSLTSTSVSSRPWTLSKEWSFYSKTDTKKERGWQTSRYSQTWANDHLRTTATNLGSRGWSLYTGLTVYNIIYQLQIFTVNIIQQGWPKCDPPTCFCSPWPFLSFERTIAKINLKLFFF